MARRIVTTSECDSFEEVAKLLQEIFDNAELVEGKVCQIAQEVEEMKPKKKKKGFVNIKTLLLIAFFSVFMVFAHGYVTTDINYDIASNPELLSQYLRDSFANMTSQTYLFTPTTTEPTGTLATEGRVYYNDTANELRVHNGTGFVSIDTASGNSLDSAYNLGVAITVDNGPVALTATNAANNTALQVVQSDTGTSLGIDINNAGSGNSIDIEGTSGNDIQGTGDTWSVTTAGAATFVGIDTTGDITLQNDETIKNDNNGEIEFGDGSEDTAFSWTSNSLDLSSDTGVVEIDFGALDSLVGINAIAFDGAVANTITQTGTGAGDDLTISQAGSVDASVHISSAGTGADAVSIQCTAGGLDIDVVDDLSIVCATNATADDFAIGLTGATNSSILVTSTGTGADAISLITSAGGMDLTVAGAAAGEDLDLTANSSVNITSTEAATDAIVISASTALGGIDITSNEDIDITTTGAAGEDISITNTGGSIIITATENDAGAIQITTNGGVTEELNITNTQGTAETAIDIDATAGGIDIDAATGKNIAVTGGQFIVTSNEDVASAISMTTNTGTSETIVVTNTQGTSEAAIDIDATAGGIDIDAATGKNIAVTGGQFIVLSNENVADAISLTTNTGTTETITVTNSQGTSAQAITLTSTAGGLTAQTAIGMDFTVSGAAADEDIDFVTDSSFNVTSTEDAANAIYLRANAGTSETVKIHADQGTSATEGAASVQITSDVGGINLLSGLNAANAINLVADAGTSETINIFSDQGTSVTEGAASINLLSDAGGISIKSTANLAKAIQIVADAGTTETIYVQADQGTGAGSITLVSDAGGITVSAGTQITTAGGLINGSVQDIPAGGTSTAIALTNTVATVGADAGGDIVTLANGTAGQIMYVICEDATGTTTLTPATFNGGTSITFDAVGDSVTLVYGTDLGWAIVGGNSYTIVP